MLFGCRYGNKILVTDELPDGQMVDQWEPVTCDFVKTPLEVCLFKVQCLYKYSQAFFFPFITDFLGLGILGAKSRGFSC